MGSTEDDVRKKLEAEAMEDKLVRLADRLGATAKAAAVFGEPVQRSGVTVIPVARARWGFGGGSGKGKDEQGEGTGAGGGVQASPVGYIEVSDGDAQYKRINDPLRTALALLVLPLSLGLSIVMLILTFALVLRRLRAAVSGRRLEEPTLPNVVPSSPRWAGLRRFGR
jgi:uncharacterized spore protein YtfJ